MKELRKRVFDALTQLVQTHSESFQEMKKEAERSGEMDTDPVHLSMTVKFSEVTRSLNQCFDECEQRIDEEFSGKNKKRGIFGR